MSDDRLSPERISERIEANVRALHYYGNPPDPRLLTWVKVDDAAAACARAIEAACAAYEPYAPDFADVAEAAALGAMRRTPEGETDARD